MNGAKIVGLAKNLLLVISTIDGVVNQAAIYGSHWAWHAKQNNKTKARLLIKKF